MQVDVKTLDNGSAGSIDLSQDVFGLEPRKDILHRMVTYQLAKRQQGSHKTKERNEITATGKKFVRQKGSGGARHGDRKAPQFRGGGKAHGPRVRSHAIDLPKKVRALALRHALSAKKAANELIVIDAASLDEGKTSVLAKKFAALGLDNALIVDRELEANFKQASRNISGVDVLPLEGANVYDILKRHQLVLTKAAVEGLEARFTGDRG
ncbi:MAG: 50S ribosomal protein L4 [Pseudomonadota bacterium]